MKIYTGYLIGLFGDGYFVDVFEYKGSHPLLIRIDADEFRRARVRDMNTGKFKNPATNSIGIMHKKQ